MQLSFKTELKPNNKQVALFRQHCRVAIHAYNWANGIILEVLTLRATAQTVKLPTTMDLQKPLLPEIKNIYPWYYNCSKPSRQPGLTELRAAWKKCFNKRLIQHKINKKNELTNLFLENKLQKLNQELATMLSVSSSLKQVGLDCAKRYPLQPHTIA